MSRLVQRCVSQKHMVASSVVISPVRYCAHPLYNINYAVFERNVSVAWVLTKTSRQLKIHYTACSSAARGCWMFKNSTPSLSLFELRLKYTWAFMFMFSTPESASVACLTLGAAQLSSGVQYLGESVVKTHPPLYATPFQVKCWRRESSFLRAANLWNFQILPNSIFRRLGFFKEAIQRPQTTKHSSKSSVKMEAAPGGLGRCSCAFWLAVAFDALGLIILLLGVFGDFFFYDFLIYAGAIIIFMSLVWWVFWYTGNIEVPPEELEDDVGLLKKGRGLAGVVRRFSSRLSSGIRSSLRRNGGPRGRGRGAEPGQTQLRRDGSQAPVAFAMSTVSATVSGGDALRTETQAIWTITYRLIAFHYV